MTPLLFGSLRRFLLFRDACMVCKRYQSLDEIQLLALIDH
jgi:hypothetical protein